MTNQILDEVFRAMGGLPVIANAVQCGTSDDLCMDAERINGVADSLCQWASDTPPGDRALQRWQAAAVLREFAGDRWSRAVRQMNSSS